jgi:hypothetical protein
MSGNNQTASKCTERENCAYKPICMNQTIRHHSNKQLFVDSSTQPHTMISLLTVPACHSMDDQQVFIALLTCIRLTQAQ